MISGEACGHGFSLLLASLVSIAYRESARMYCRKKVFNSGPYVSRILLVGSLSSETLDVISFYKNPLVLLLLASWSRAVADVSVNKIGLIKKRSRISRSSSYDINIQV